ncbi:uncharacterized protein EI97DRAFT_477473 [Westerdykella ornata]|uniref:Extracellular membrane protein CFEM domain-containing protein n=1 Tax=Westerdykella ornata TaxID=318751 RepID=A0A6A6JVX8_WESOR|nr:uncharacterized protein EI97DRAFT_477473 [Westerdykella ornata]KAF2279968.1 hypothetical protein EI97DRAFT_477473 [Westerdykella ornata]
MTVHRTAGALVMVHALLLLVPKVPFAAAAIITPGSDINAATEPIFIPINVAPTVKVCDSAGVRLLCLLHQVCSQRLVDDSECASLTPPSSTAHCTLITTCIPGGEPTPTQSCARGDRGCTSCPDKGPKACVTISPPSGSARQIFCAALDEDITSTLATTPTLSEAARHSGGTTIDSALLTITSSSPAQTNVNAPAPATTNLNPPEPTTSNKTKTFPPTTKSQIIISISAILGAITVSLGLFCAYKCLVVHRRRHAPDSFRRNRVASGGPPGTSHSDHGQGRVGVWRAVEQKAERGYEEKSWSGRKHGVMSAAEGEDKEGIDDDVDSSTSPASDTSTTTNGEDDKYISPTPVPNPITTATRNHSEYSPTSAPSRNPPTSTPTPTPPHTPSPPPPASPSNSNVPELMRQNSSLLLPTSGPYLSAETALGSGYWRAEREQMMADEVLKVDALELLEMERWVYGR